MKAISSVPVIHVSNLKSAITYYQQILGFKPDFIFDDGVFLHLEEICIHLSRPEDPGIKKTPGQAHLCIDLEEVDAYYQNVMSKGAIIQLPLAERSYGMRDFALGDPDGNTLVFGSAMPPQIQLTP